MDAQKLTTPGTRGGRKRTFLEIAMTGKEKPKPSPPPVAESGEPPAAAKKAASLRHTHGLKVRQCAPLWILPAIGRRGKPCIPMHTPIQDTLPGGAGALKAVMQWHAWATRPRYRSQDSPPCTLFHLQVDILSEAEAAERLRAEERRLEGESEALARQLDAEDRREAAARPAAAAGRGPMSWGAAPASVIGLSLRYRYLTP